MGKLISLEEELQAEYDKKISRANDIISLEDEELRKELYERYSSDIYENNLESLSEDVFDDNCEAYIDVLNYIIDTSRESKANGIQVGDFTCKCPKEYCKSIDSCRNCDMYEECIYEFEEMNQYGWCFVEEFPPEEECFLKLFDSFLERGYYFRLENKNEVNYLSYMSDINYTNYSEETLEVIKAQMTIAESENKKCFIEVNSPQTILMPDVFVEKGDNIFQCGDNYLFVRKED